MTADPKRIKQVIINLLSNSIKFTPEGGKVEVIASKSSKNDKIFVKVVDNGIGIPPQDIYKVMSVFGQSDSEYSRNYEGSGLGLPLSKKLVELMGGAFALNSTPNVGTTVTLTFPCANQTDSDEF